MNNTNLIKSLEFIRNKGFCCYTAHRAIKEFDKIKSYLNEEDRKKIEYYMLELDPDYPDYCFHSHFTCEMFAYHIEKIIKSIKLGTYRRN